MPLAVRGFAAQEHVAVAHIVRALEWLPRAHLRGLREIFYLPGPHGRWGEYVQAERTIYMHRTDDPALFWHVLYHEVGHHVYFLVLDSAAKTGWTALYPGSACATPYGRAGVAEDFAECYALYAQDTRSLSDFPEKRAYLRDTVFASPVPSRPRYPVVRT